VKNRWVSSGGGGWGGGGGERSEQVFLRMTG